MRLLWLADELRAAGLDVHEVAGWRDRGRSDWSPRGIICHATAGSSTSTDVGEIRVLLEGSATAPPPIAQLYLSRTGAFHVIASGRCNHALTGWGGPLDGYGNDRLIGIEAQNDNRGQPWPAVQVQAYVRGVAAICRRMGWTDPGRHVAAHREHQPYPPPSWTRSSKSDPHGIDMKAFRAQVRAVIEGDDMLTSEERQWLKDIRWAVGRGVPREGHPGEMHAITWGWGVLMARVQAIADRVDVDPAEVAAIAAALPQADDIADLVLSGLGQRSPTDVARALVAAGQDPGALAAALAELAEPVVPEPQT